MLFKACLKQSVELYWKERDVHCPFYVKRQEKVSHTGLKHQWSFLGALLWVCTEVGGARDHLSVDLVGLCGQCFVFIGVQVIIVIHLLQFCVGVISDGLPPWTCRYRWNLPLHRFLPLLLWQQTPAPTLAPALLDPLPTEALEETDPPPTETEPPPTDTDPPPTETEPPPTDTEVLLLLPSPSTV